MLRDVLPRGTRLNGGAYEVSYPLGQGGFGITYLGRHLVLDVPVAIKEFFPKDAVARAPDDGHVSVYADSRLEYDRWLKRFIHEGQVLARLQHPNVVDVTNLFTERGTAYLVMDLVEGSTLREALKAAPEGRLPEAQVHSVAEQLVGALAAIHSKGVCHLDIKPDNILMSPTGQAVLSDFGAAREGTGSRTTQAFTFAYAPLELIQPGQPTGPESDIFELGMMLHELLTGRLPPSVISRLGDATWVPEDVTEPWRGLLTQALRLHLTDRPRSVTVWWQGQAVPS